MPSISDSDSSKEQINRGNERFHLYLNVYDLTTINNYLYWFGLGIFHTGIEAHGTEYAFGAHEYPTSGVFEVEPKSCPGFIYRRSVWLGSTGMSRSEFKSFMEHLSGNYHGDTYHLIAKNCNHFTDDVCMHLTGKHIPGWVNRLARLGSFCNCLLPESIQLTAVRHLPEHLAYTGELAPAHMPSVVDLALSFSLIKLMLSPSCLAQLVGILLSDSKVSVLSLLKSMWCGFGCVVCMFPTSTMHLASKKFSGNTAQDISFILLEATDRIW